MTVTAEAVTYADVRDSVAIARSHGEKFFEQIVWQVEHEVWTILGYGSWDEMREAEYKDLGVVAPRADRPELVARLRVRGLTQEQIAGTLGVGQSTVARDLAAITQVGNGPTDPIVNARGESRPATYAPRVQPAPEPVDDLPPFDPTTGELLNYVDPTPERTTDLDGKSYPKPTPAKPRRKPLTDTFTRLSIDLTKKVAAIVHLSEDDRFPQNAEKVATANRSDLLRAIDALQRVVDRLSTSPNL